jgi:glycosyltransferase involved in cell wall biosynthesis
VARLAFVTPLPPAATGIADYSAEVLALLAPAHAIDVFHAQDEIDAARVPAGCRVLQARAFLEQNARAPYELAIYQLGNAPAHAFQYELIPRVPGLLVLHDLVLHHSRARMFLESEECLAYAREPWSARAREAAARRVQGYRDEVAYCYPQAAARLDEVHLATVGDLLPYAYPLFRLPVEASRATAVHNAYMAEAVRNELPGARVVSVVMPVSRPPAGAVDAAAIRARHGIAGDFVVGCFGLLTREKRIAAIARAAARARECGVPLTLLFVGPLPDAPALHGLLREHGLASRAVVTGRVPFDELPAYMQAADVVIQLRYPTARETSAALLRVLAQGRATVISDLEHLSDIPDDAVVRADVSDEEGELTRAILRLFERPDLRARFGRNAAAFAGRAHSPARCRESYEHAIAAALQAALPAANPAWPSHWRAAAPA